MYIIDVYGLFHPFPINSPKTRQQRRATTAEARNLVKKERRTSYFLKVGMLQTVSEKQRNW